MTKRVLFPLLTVVLFSGLASTGLLRGEIIQTRLDNEIIHAVSAEYIIRGLDYANERHAQAFLLLLSTPGGLLESTRAIVEKMLASRVPVIVYVSPSGARSASAGFFLLMAADVAVMSPGTNTGAAHPVSAFGAKIEETMKQKLENDTAAYVRSMVQKRNRNSLFAEKAVLESKSFTDKEALEAKLIDAVSQSRDQLIETFEGKEIIRFDGSRTTLKLKGERIVEFPMTTRQQFLTRIMNPNIALILAAVGILGLYLEFTHPGLIFPGVAGGISILLALFAFHLLPINFTGVALILLAIVLFIIEAKVVSHGILATGGVIAGIIGSLILVDSPIPELQIHKSTAFAVFIPLALITVFLLRLVIIARRRKAVTGKEDLLGAEGVVTVAIETEGKVFLHGEYWNARAREKIDSGTPVVVDDVEGLTLFVRRK